MRIDLINQTSECACHGVNEKNWDNTVDIYSLVILEGEQFVSTVEITSFGKFKWFFENSTLLFARNLNKLTKYEITTDEYYHEYIFKRFS